MVRARQSSLRTELNDLFSWSVSELQAALRAQGYHLDDRSARRLRSYLRQGKPVGLRGEPGIGKSELPAALARALGANFFDLACHSELDSHEVGISWNAYRQLIDAQTLARSGPDLYTMEYLNRTPLLESLLSERPAVVRIDEVDKLNEHTTNFFLRYLDKQELIVHDLHGGDKVIRPCSQLYIFLTSNEYQELDPAFHRRVAWLELTFPPVEALAAIIRDSVGVPEAFALRAAQLVAHVRNLNLRKKPAISEALEWTRAVLDESDGGELTPAALDVTLGFLVKYPEDEELAAAAVRRWADATGRHARHG